MAIQSGEADYARFFQIRRQPPRMAPRHREWVPCFAWMLIFPAAICRWMPYNTPVTAAACFAFGFAGRQINVIHSTESLPPMNITDIPFGTTDWSQVAPTEHQGETGLAYWRTCQFGAIRVRMVEYTAGYLADHWCSKGHILLCLEGELITELQDGRKFTLKPGMSYQVADHAEAHRSFAPAGAKLFVVD